MRHIIENKLPQEFIRSKYHDKFMWELADLIFHLNNSEAEKDMDDYINKSKKPFEALLQKAVDKGDIAFKEKQSIVEVLSSIKSIYKDSTDYALYHKNSHTCAYESFEGIKVKEAHFCSHTEELSMNKSNSSLIDK